MKPSAVFAIFVFMLYIPARFPKQSGGTKAYTADAPYEVYNVVVRHEEAYEMAKGTVAIRQETLKTAFAHGCVTQQAANKFKDAIADFQRVNNQQWVLQPRFDIGKHYELVSLDSITMHPPDVRGTYISLSAVGFDRTKAKAVVYAQSSCGGLCGSARFHFLEKLGGKWKEVNGVTCAMAS